MKKILIISTILAANAFAFDSVTYFGGVNAEGELTVKTAGVREKQNQDYHFVVGAELNKKMRTHKNIEFGLGVKYEDDFTVESSVYGKSDFAASVPVYATAKYAFPIDRDSRVYVKANLGYNFVIDGDYIKDIKDDYPNSKCIDTEGGIYTGLGFGMEVNSFVAELNYNVTKVNYVNQNNKEYDYDNAKVSATVGYKFDM